MTGAGIEDLPLAELVGRVADSPVAPGGGAVSGVALALAASLVVKAARGSAETWPGAGGAAAQAQRLRARAEALPEASRRAFGEAVTLMRSRTGGGERDMELRGALERAAQVPLQTTGIAASVAALALHVAQEGRDELRPEAVVACVIAEACCVAAAHLVEINLAVLPDDERLLLAAEHVREAREARERVLAVAGR